MKLAFGLALALFCMVGSALRAEPGKDWQEVDPASAGWSAARLERARGLAQELGPTGVLVVRDGVLVARWGDVEREVNVASVRKSLLSALYGIAAGEGRIDINASLAQLKIDDKPPSLTDIEKQATIRDLLMARSGIYHPAASETAAMKRNRPVRGSHAPGTFWFYNNWDFNTLGAIYRQRTGEDIFASFATRIAEPIGMQDFSAGDGRYISDPASDMPAYQFRLSARDMARFGLLFLQQGQWLGRQIVPADWVRQSTTAYSQSDRGRQGYGYMWWVLPTDVWGEGAAYAAGFGGQFIAYVPAKHLVVVQTVDLRDNREGVRTSDFLKLLRAIADAAP